MTGGTGSRPRGARRIDLFLPLLAGGGAEQAALDLASGLAGRGLHARLVLASARGPLLDDVDPAVQVVDLGAARTATAIPRLARLLRHSPPDALVSSLTHANIAAVVARLLARSDVPLVLTEQNMLREAARTGRRRDRALPIVARRTHAHADAVVACSAGVADHLRQELRLRTGGLLVVRNPVITPELLAAAGAPLELPWPGDDVQVVVAAGRLVPAKGFDTLLRAFALLRRQRPVHLVLLGEGPERGALVALAEHLGIRDALHLPGFVPNPYAPIARADVFALSSRHEGMPNVLVAALALGTSIVATDCPSGPSELLDGGRFGTLVPVDDVDALAAALEDTLELLPGPPPDDAWRPYTLDWSVERYLELFHRLWST